MVLLSKDRLFAYWEIDERRLTPLGCAEADLRLLDVERSTVVSRQVVKADAGRTYLDAPEPGRTYAVELVFAAGDGVEVVLSRSRSVVAPAGAVSERRDQS